MADVTLTMSVRDSLLSLQNTKSLLDRTQGRLNTQLKVASAVDNAVAYFQAKTLSDRATDFEEKKESINQGVSSLSTAIQGVSGVESLVRSLKGLALSAKSASTGTIASLVSQFNDLRTQINQLTADATYQGLNLINGSGSTLTVDFSNQSSSLLNVASVNVRVDKLGLNIRKAVSATGGLMLGYGSTTGSTVNKGEVITMDWGATGQTLTEGTYSTSYGTSTLTFYVASAGSRTATFTTTEQFNAGDNVYVRMVSASTYMVSTGQDTMRTTITSNGGFAVENGGNLWMADAQQGLSGGTILSFTFNGTQSTLASGTYTFTYGSATLSIIVGSVGATTTTFTNTEAFAYTEGPMSLTISTQNEASGVGIVKLTAGYSQTYTGAGEFNASGTYIASASGLVAHTVYNGGVAGGITLSAITGQYVLDANTVGEINKLVDDLEGALETLRARTQVLGSNVSLLQTRLDFTDNYTKTLTKGAGKLTLADMNEEGANLLALQTRQQLAIQALSFAGQAEQSLLSLFR